MRRRRKRAVRGKLLKDGSPKEWVIQSAVIDWLETTGLMFWRQNSGTLFFRGRKVFLGPVGGADISLIGPGGRFCGIEVKSARGKPNKKQLVYAPKLIAAGGMYFIVRSLEQAKAAVAEVIGACT